MYIICAVERVNYARRIRYILYSLRTPATGLFNDDDEGEKSNDCGWVGGREREKESDSERES